MAFPCNRLMVNEQPRGDVSEPMKELPVLSTEQPDGPLIARHCEDH
jgi:hypothetical protein